MVLESENSFRFYRFDLFFRDWKQKTIPQFRIVLLSDLEHMQKRNKEKNVKRITMRDNMYIG